LKLCRDRACPCPEGFQGKNSPDVCSGIMKRIVHKAKDFKDAEEYDIMQHNEK